MERQQELQRAKYRQAITLVLTRVVVIAEKVPPEKFTDKYWDDTDRHMAPVRQLMAIDVTQCPQDFQSAYVDWARA